MAEPAAPASASLEALLRAEIGTHGPITVARFMALALGHADLGYYTTREPLGAAGDFVTAPEVGQAFGEIVGLWLAEAWMALGGPDPVRLVELGPGHGTLMADLLRATAKVPPFQAALRVHLVETSQRLCARQRAQLPDVDVIWHDRFDQVPEDPLLLIANEFFDVLPVRQLQLTAAGWVERRIGLDAHGQLAFQADTAPSTLAPDVPTSGTETLGKIEEVSAVRAGLAAAIGARLAKHGGVALVIDYGAWVDGPTGDTLQAVRGHEPVAPLSAPGRADLTTQVNFRALAEAAATAGAAVYGPVPQGPFLRAFGIDLRTAQLLQRASPEQSRVLRAALFRLTDASAMGELFKVLVLAGPNDPPPPGFTAPTLVPRPTDQDPCRQASEACKAMTPSPSVPVLNAANLGRLPGIRHGFCTRQGGVSDGPFDSLNCGFSGGDEPVRVEANRARAMQWLGMPPGSLRTARQVHGIAVLTARSGQIGPASEEADAVVTDRSGVTVGVLSADCVPVLIADPEAGVVGAAHAGWRGALAGVVEATVAAMVALGARPAAMTAAVGPCIAQASYEVGPELRQMFMADDPSTGDLFRSVAGSDRLLLDLERHVLGRLDRAGVRDTCGLAEDTHADPARFFSARRTRNAGGDRFGLLLSAIGLAG